MFFMLSPAPHSCLQSLCACQFVFDEGDGRKERLMGWVKERGRKEGRWINELSKDTAALEMFPQARERRTNGPSVLLALLGGRRGESRWCVTMAVFAWESGEGSQSDYRGLLKRTFAMRRVRGEDMMGTRGWVEHEKRWEIKDWLA